MDTLIQYDVAISCAEEDLTIAEAIACKLRNEKISYYLYTEHQARHWGENLLKTSIDMYGAYARYVLMLISQTYVTKHWSDMERQIAQTVTRVGEAYILPLRLDETHVEGLSKNIVFQVWKDNPEQIAGLIAAKVHEKKIQEKNDRTKNTAQIVYNIHAEKPVIAHHIDILNM